MNKILDEFKLETPDSLDIDKFITLGEKACALTHNIGKDCKKYETIRTDL